MACLALAMAAPAFAQSPVTPASTQAATPAAPPAATAPKAAPAAPTQAAAGNAAAVPATSATIAGTIDFTEGDVSVYDSSLAARPSLKSKDAINVGDSIVTGKDGEVHLAMQDGGYLAVRPGTTYATTGSPTFATAS